MERLTVYKSDIARNVIKEGISTRTVNDRLADYEDLEEQGRLVILPCNVGDTVYQLRHKQHAKGVGISPRIVSSACVWSDGSYALCHQGMPCCQSKDLGETWFLSREEAEKALRGE